MAKMTTPASSTPQRPMLLVPRDEAKRKIKAQIDKGRKLNLQIQTMSNPEMMIEELSKWGGDTYDLLTRLFNVPDYARDFHSQFVGSFAEWTNTSITLQRPYDRFNFPNILSSLLDRLELIPEDPGLTHSITVSETRQVTPSNKVFVVHGHHDASKHEVARFLEKLGLEAVILHEQPNRGQTIIEKLVSNSDVAFAVVLLTPDDVGACKADFDKNAPGALKDRARQNVVFELGFFMAKLGRERVAALLVGDVELQSDIQGVHYTPLDQAGAWKSALAKEMRDSGMDVDLNKA